MSVDQLVGAALAGAAAVVLLAGLSWVALEQVGKYLLRKDERRKGKTTHELCDVCANPDPHGLELVRERLTGRLRLVCRGCATEGAALGNYVVLERRRGGRS